LDRINTIYWMKNRLIGSTVAISMLVSVTLATPGNPGTRAGNLIAGTEAIRAVVTQAQAEVESKRYGQAIAKLTAALQETLEPRIAAFLRAKRAEALIGKNDLARAQEDADAAIRLDPKSAEGHFVRGLVYQRKENNDRAIAEYTIAIGIRPGFVVAYNNRGVAYTHNSHLEDARRDFDHALRLDPNYVNAYVSRGAAYEALGERDKALADYNEAIRRKPDVENARL
jgi:tetratricopeptide (TPR) repeat protein